MNLPRLTLHMDDILKIVHHDVTEYLIELMRQENFDFKDINSLDEYVDIVANRATEIYSQVFKEELYQQIAKALSHINPH